MSKISVWEKKEGKIQNCSLWAEKNERVVYVKRVSKGFQHILQYLPFNIIALAVIVITLCSFRQSRVTNKEERARNLEICAILFCFTVEKLCQILNNAVKACFNPLQSWLILQSRRKLSRKKQNQLPIQHQVKKWSYKRVSGEPLWWRFVFILLIL